MKPLLILLTIIAISSCRQNNPGGNRTFQLQSQEISEYEIYGVINTMIDPSNSDCTNHTKYIVGMNWLENTKFLNQLFDLVDDQDSLLTKKDVEFIRFQAKSFFDFELKQEFLKYNIFIPEDSLEILKTDKYNGQIYRENLERKYGTYRLPGISLPLFSIDRNVVIVTRDCFIGGGVDIYRKENDKWILVRSLLGWT